jgi:hypothetical protein
MKACMLHTGLVGSVSILRNNSNNRLYLDFWQYGTHVCKSCRTTDMDAAKAMAAEVDQRIKRNLDAINGSEKTMRVLETFVRICSHRWRALPADSPEKKVIAEAIAILDSQ